MAKKFYSEDDVNGRAIVYSSTAPVGFTEITDYDTLIELQDKEYKRIEQDGRDFHRHFKTRLRLEYDAGNITMTEVLQLEAHLKALKEELRSGDWLSASVTNTNMALLGIFDQSLKDEVQAGINAYIAENY